MDWKLLEYITPILAALIFAVWMAARWWFTKQNPDNGHAKYIRTLEGLSQTAKEIQQGATNQHEQIISLQRECAGHFGVLQQEISSLLASIASYAQKLDIHRKEEETMVQENNRILTRTDQDGLPLVYRDAKHEKTVVQLLGDIKQLMERWLAAATGRTKSTDPS